MMGDKVPGEWWETRWRETKWWDTKWWKTKWRETRFRGSRNPARHRRRSWKPRHQPRASRGWNPTAFCCWEFVRKVLDLLAMWYRSVNKLPTFDAAKPLTKTMKTKRTRLQNMAAKHARKLSIIIFSSLPGFCAASWTWNVQLVIQVTWHTAGKNLQSCPLNTEHVTFCSKPSASGPKRCALISVYPESPIRC